jgi:hypothetical protein
VKHMNNLGYPRFEIDAQLTAASTVIKLDGKVLEGIRAYKLHCEGGDITRLELEMLPEHVQVSGEGVLFIRHDGKVYRFVDCCLEVT